MSWVSTVRERWFYDDPLHFLKPVVDQHIVSRFPEQLKESVIVNTNFHTLLFGLGTYSLLFHIGKLWLLVPQVRSKLETYKDKVDLSVRTVSFIQSIIICALSIPVFDNPYLNKDHVFATTPYSQFFLTMALSYFIWDTVVSLYYVKYFGIGFLIHGIVSSIVFTIAVEYQFIHYYGAIFLLFESSTPFLNIRWVGLKLNLLHDSMELLNNVILILIFFFIRILWGWYQVFRLAVDFWQAQSDPRFTHIGAFIILFCNGTLDVLNIFWFSKMMIVAITTVKQMFGVVKQDEDNKKLKLM